MPVAYCTSGLHIAALSVVQQAAAVRTHSDLQVGEYTDLEKTSVWTDQKWSQEIIENQVCLFFNYLNICHEKKMLGFILTIYYTIFIYTNLPSVFELASPAPYIK